MYKNHKKPSVLFSEDIIELFGFFHTGLYLKEDPKRWEIDSASITDNPVMIFPPSYNLPRTYLSIVYLTDSNSQSQGWMQGHPQMLAK